MKEPVHFRRGLYLAPFYLAGDKWVYLFLGEKPIIEKALKKRTSLEKKRGVERKEIPTHIWDEFKEVKKVSSLYLQFKKIYPDKKLNFVVLDHKLQKRRFLAPLMLISEEL